MISKLFYVTRIFLCCEGLFKEISILFLTATTNKLSEIWFLFRTLITGDMIWLWGCGGWLGLGQNKQILLKVLAFEFFVSWVYFLILMLLKKSTTSIYKQNDCSLEIEILHVKRWQQCLKNYFNIFYNHAFIDVFTVQNIS